MRLLQLFSGAEVCVAAAEALRKTANVLLQDSALIAAGGGGGSSRLVDVRVDLIRGDIAMTGLGFGTKRFVGRLSRMTEEQNASRMSRMGKGIDASRGAARTPSPLGVRRGRRSMMLLGAPTHEGMQVLMKGIPTALNSFGKRNSGDEGVTIFRSNVLATNTFTVHGVHLSGLNPPTTFSDLNWRNDSGAIEYEELNAPSISGVLRDAAILLREEGQQAAIERVLREMLASADDLLDIDVDVDVPLVVSSLIDSRGALELRRRWADAFDLELPATLLFDYPSLS